MMENCRKIKTELLLPSPKGDHQLPEALELHPSGFLVDNQYLYSVRRSITEDAEVGQTGESLYNGCLQGDKKPSHNATEGHGIYAANTPKATEVFGIKGKTLYGLRTPLNDVTFLDKDARSEDLTPRQKAAARLHSLRSNFPGIPNPGTKGWDKLYEEAEAVTFAPMLIARLAIGRSVQLDSVTLKPKWILIRSAEKAQIISKHSSVLN
jgi:hypothetical protein